jgi:hypothetical protein
MKADMEKLPVCPNCGYEAKSDQDPLITAHDGMGECPACGIVVAKYRQQSKGPARGSAEKKAACKKPYTRIAVAILIIGVSFLIYWFIPPLSLFDPGDPTFGAIAESAGGSFSNYTAFSRGKYLRIRSISGRWRWTARAARQPSALALSTTGRRLVTAALPGVVSVWEKGLLWYKPVCDLESDIEDVTALTFTTDETYVVVIGNNDRKLEVFDIGERRLLAQESLQGRDLDSFLLKLTVDATKGVYDVALSEASLAYLQENAVSGGGRWRLQDQISGRFVQTCNDGWKASFEPAKSLSWNPRGRYSAYAEKDSVSIWKLCPTRICKFGRKS